MGSIQKRARTLIKKAGVDSIAGESDITHSRWLSVTYKNVRMSTEALEVIQKVFPNYLLWLISGEIAPKVGQTSPEYDLQQMSENLEKEKRMGQAICEKCGKKLDASQIRVSENSKLDSNENCFIIVCDACNSKIG